MRDHGGRNQILPFQNNKLGQVFLLYFGLTCSSCIPDEKSKAKKKVNVRPGPGTMNPLAAGDQGSGSLRHLLTTKTIMEPP